MGTQTLCAAPSLESPCGFHLRVVIGVWHDLIRAFSRHFPLRRQLMERLRQCQDQDRPAQCIGPEGGTGRRLDPRGGGVAVASTSRSEVLAPAMPRTPKRYRVTTSVNDNSSYPEREGSCHGVGVTETPSQLPLTSGVFCGIVGPPG